MYIFPKYFRVWSLFVLPFGHTQTLPGAWDGMFDNVGHYLLFVFRKRTPKAPPVQNKERKKSEKRKPQTLTVSDESEELESEVRNI